MLRVYKNLASFVQPLDDMAQDSVDISNNIQDYHHNDYISKKEEFGSLTQILFYRSCLYCIAKIMTQNFLKFPNKELKLEKVK